MTIQNLEVTEKQERDFNSTYQSQQEIFLLVEEQLAKHSLKFLYNEDIILKKIEINNINQALMAFIAEIFPKLTVEFSKDMFVFIKYLHKSLNEYGTKYLKSI